MMRMALSWITKPKRALRSRRGVSLVETIAAVMIMSLLMITVGRLSALELSEVESIDAQYGMLAADAFMSDIYDDFHAATSYSFTESPAGQRSLTFTKPDGSAVIYSYSPTEMACYKNGIFQFDANRFDVIGTTANMTVAVKLPNERLLQYTIYR